MKRFHLLLLTCLLQAAASKAQKLTNYLDSLKDGLSENINKSNRLVSNYTFRHILLDDFALLMTGEKNKTVPGKYAALDINSDEQRFTMTPLFIAPDPKKEAIHHLFSVEVTGAVNSKKAFDFKNRNTLALGFSYTFADGKYNFIDKNKPDTATYHNLYSQLADKIKEDYLSEDEKLVLDSLKAVKKAGNRNKLKNTYYDEVKDAEIILVDDSWTRKSFYWIKVSANLFSREQFYYTDTANITTYTEPVKKVVYNPNLIISYNHYCIFRSNIHIFASAYIKLSRKHSLSEIYSTRQWNKINKVNDSIYYADEQKDVYTFNPSQYSTLFFADCGVQFIAIAPIKNFSNIGLDFKYDRIGFITPGTKNATSSINKFSIGVIFPFKDKTDKNAINIEPFYEYRQYIDYEKVHENTFGIRFVLPFNTIL